MDRLNRIHAQSFRKAASEIIKPTMDAGGTESSVMVVLESTVTAVLLALNRNDGKMAATMLEEGLVPGVLQRISDQQAKSLS